MNLTKLTNSASFSQAFHYNFLVKIYPIESRFKKKVPIIIIEVDTNGNLKNSPIRPEKYEPKPEDIKDKSLLIPGKFYGYT